MVGDFLIELFVGDDIRTVRVAIAAVYEHQVDIGAVIQLLPAQLAERNYRKSTGAAIGQARFAVAHHEVVAEVPVHDAQNRVGHARKLLCDLRQTGHPQHVAQRDPQQLAPAKPR